MVENEFSRPNSSHTFAMVTDAMVTPTVATVAMHKVIKFLLSEKIEVSFLSVSK